MADERVVGIDLGTTNSLVAFMQGEKPVVIPGEDGVNLVPSVVALGPARDGTRPAMVVGNGARTTLLGAPERAIYSVKRLMGRGVEDVAEELKFFPFRLVEEIQPGEVLRIRLGEAEFTPPEISAHILRQLKRNAERYFGAPVFLELHAFEAQQILGPVQRALQRAVGIVEQRSLRQAPFLLLLRGPRVHVRMQLTAVAVELLFQCGHIKIEFGR